ncbi:MAG: glutamate--tRNA ligase [Patescibacteria group bacterium]
MVRTRIAPSPTGADVHVGSVATALMNFAYAKKNKGQFIIRIEDTDRTRIVKGGEAQMLKTLKRIGLVADESPEVGGPYAPYRQSERLDIYKKHAEELVAKGKAYYCICMPERLTKMREEQQAKKKIPKYDRLCLSNQNEIIKQIKEKQVPHVIRLLIPDGQIKFNDVVRGEIMIDSQNIDDQIILKSDGFPTYHLGVVVDDYLMKITHVIRGEEWLPSTPKHIILYRVFGWEPPVFVHISLLRNPDKSKLSKRKNPVWTSFYLDQGIFPEALLNYLSQMGWSHPEGKDIFSLDEYIKVFDIKDIQKTAPVFDPVKLEWMNGMYIRKYPVSSIKYKVLEFYKEKNINLDEDLVGKTIPLIQDRIKKLSDYFPLCEFFFKAPKIYEIDLNDKKDFFKEVFETLNQVNDWKAIKIGEELANLAKKLNIKNSQFFMDMRMIITGKKISPPLNESMEILGKNACLDRLTLK